MLINPSSLSTLIAQFQAHYPMGSLTSELLTIHEGSFVVRAVACIGGNPLATGMASATDLEQAEDRAKVRALTALGVNIYPSAIQRQGAAYPLSPAFSQPVGSPLPSPAPPPQSHFGQSSFDQNSLSSLETSQDTFDTAISSSATVSTTVSTDVPGTDISSVESSAYAPEAYTPEAYTPEAYTPEIQLPSSEDWSLGADELVSETAELDFYATPSSTPTASMDALSTDATFPESSEPSPSPPEAVKTASSKAKSPKRKAASSEPHLEPLADTKPLTTTDLEEADRSGEIARIGVEMKRLGWTTEQGRNYLKRTYGKRSRQELDDSELLDFLRYLETLPSSAESPF